MVIYTDEIYTFAGESLALGEGKSPRLEALCAAASAELMGRLREGVKIEDIKPLFVSAAGVLALSMYIAAEDEGQCSFKAGNLSVSSGSKAASAHSLRLQAEAMLAAYMADRGFEFRSVG